MTEKPQSYIYFIRQVGGIGPVKIGSSCIPERRLAALACWSPYPLEIVATVQGSMKMELRLHNCLANSHSHHEWFHPTDDVLSVVANVKAGKALHEAIDLKTIQGRLQKRKRVFPEVLRNYISYNTRMYAAVRRAEKYAGARQWAPENIHDIVDAVRSGCDLSREEIALFEAFTLAPQDFCLDKFIMRAA